MKQYITLGLLSLFLSICVNTRIFSASVQDDYQTIKNLREEWLKVDEHNKYIPFVEDGNDSDSPVIGVIIDLQRYSGNDLLCRIPPASSLLIEQQIVGHYDKASVVVLNIDSLQQTYNSNQILVSVYTPSKRYEALQLLIVKEGGEDVGVKNISSRRADTPANDFFIVGLLVLLVSYAFQMNQYPKTFRKLYDLRKVFSFKIREEVGKIRLINEANLVFLIHHCFMVSYLLVLLLSVSDKIDLTSIVDQPQTFSAFIFTWFKITLGVFLLVFLKYFVVMMFGTLFGLRNLKYMHVFDFMRMSLIFWSILFTAFILIFSGFSTAHPMYTTILLYAFIAFAIVRIFILYSRLFTSSSFRNLYLFSYICTSEVIPLLIGIELFVN